MALNRFSELATSYSRFVGPPGAQSIGGPKRRLEEILGYDTEMQVFNKKLCSSMWQPQMALARQTYMSDQMRHGDLSMPYVQRQSPATQHPHGPLAPLPNLQIPAFGRDRIEDISGKFDLVMNTLTSLYASDAPPLEANKLLFHYTGLMKPCSFALKEEDHIRTVIEKNMYGKGDNETEEHDVRGKLSVNEAFKVHMADRSVDPVVTLIPFNLLQQHIKESNKVLENQFVSQLRGRSYSDLKSAVLQQHGSHSVVSLLTQLNSPEEFYDTFLPRGILSSRCTGRTVPYSNGTPYQGVVTIQSLGTLQVDVEDGDHGYEVGTTLNTGTLYLIVEMRQLVANDDKFNYPWVQMLLTPKSFEQLEADILDEQSGRCVAARDGSRTKTIIKPIAQLKNGPYTVHAIGDVDARQYREFDIVMGLPSSEPRSVVFQH